MKCKCYYCENGWNARTSEELIKCPKCDSFEWNKGFLDRSIILKMINKGIMIDGSSILGKKRKMENVD